MKLWADERQSSYSTGVVPVILQRVAHALYLICEIVTYRYPPLLSLPFLSAVKGPELVDSSFPGVQEIEESPGKNPTSDVIV